MLLQLSYRKPVVLDDFRAHSSRVLCPHAAAGTGSAYNSQHHWKILGPTSRQPSAIEISHQCKSRQSGSSGVLRVTRCHTDTSPQVDSSQVRAIFTPPASPSAATSSRGSPNKPFAPGTHDSFCGMGAMPFPSLVNGRIERGRWCRGCEHTCETQCLKGLEPELLARLVPRNTSPIPHFTRMRYTAWSKSEMLQHAKECPFADWVISTKWRKGFTGRYLSGESD
jgi:hypothetical protein